MRPNDEIIFVLISISVAIKKGNNDGTTLFAKSNNPFWAAGKVDFEKNNKQKVKAKITSEIIFLFNFKTSI